MFGSGGDVVVIFTSEAQFSAVTLVHNVPQLFGGQRLVHQCVLPQTENHHEAAIPRSERCEEVLLIVSADLDGIWDELGSLLLGHRGHVFQQDSDSGFPAEDVTVETKTILRQIKASLKQYVLLQGTRVVNYKSLCIRKFLKDFTKILVPLFVCGTENIVPALHFLGIAAEMSRSNWVGGCEGGGRRYGGQGAI